MSKDLSLEIGVGVSISKDTAELALKVVNMYCNDNNLTIRITPYSDKDGGTMKFEAVRYPVKEKEK